MTDTPTPAGWYPDGSGGQRWWDGLAWTEHTTPPPAAPAVAGPAVAAPAVAAPAVAAPAVATRPVVTPASAQAPAVSSRIPAPLLAIGAGGVALVVGAFLPWVSIFVFSFTGVSIRYGLATLAIGIVALVIAAQLATGRVVNARLNGKLAIAGVALGLIALAIAGYVGFAIRDSVAESNAGDDTSSSSSEEYTFDLSGLLQISTGSGVYVTGLGGIAVAAGSGFVVANKRRETR